MGIEERDWYREEHARKNGMRYNVKNATYSAARKATHSKRPTLENHRPRSAVERMRAENRKVWAANLWKLYVLALCLVALLVILRRV